MPGVRCLVVLATTIVAVTAAQAQLTQQGPKLVPFGGVARSQQGKSVALSADGNTALVGASDDGGETGAVWVFTRANGTWTQVQKLVGTGEVLGYGLQGWSVALSDDGSTAAIGGPRDGLNADHTAVGAAWIFVRSGTRWIQQGPKLVGTGAVSGASQGGSVSLSGDGNTVLIGGHSDNSFTGAAWVFRRSGGIWTQDGSKLVGTGANGAARQGSAVSLSSDGRTAVLGGPHDSGGTGAAWVFTRTPTGWTQQGSKLVGTGAVGSAQQGYSVATSSDGTATIVGGYADGASVGAAWIFTRSGDTWSQQGAKLTPRDASGAPSMGVRVAISADGDLVLAGGLNDAGGAGAAWLFSRASGSWTQQGAKLVGEGAVGAAGQGWGVALAPDGRTAIVGGAFDDNSLGAAWVFVEDGGAWAQQGSKLVGTGALGTAATGASVGISADGNTAVLGSFGDAYSVPGAAWVFSRTAGGWSQVGGALVRSGISTSSLQGFSVVAISGDGDTILVGDPRYSSSDRLQNGAAWFYVRGAHGWTQQGPPLVGGPNPDSFGGAVALSADGNTAVIGVVDHQPAGAAVVVSRSGGAWAQEGGFLAATTSTLTTSQGSTVAISSDGNTVILGNRAFMGLSALVFVRDHGAWHQQGGELQELVDRDFGSTTRVALSADGNTALIGAPAAVSGFDAASDGVVFVYTRADGVWTRQAELVSPGDAVGTTSFGTSVALSADGNSALVGASRDNAIVGAAWIFQRHGDTWVEQGPKLVGADSLGASWLGTSAALSADASTALLGGPQDSGGVGAAWVFARIPPCTADDPSVLCIDDVPGDQRFEVRVHYQTTQGGGLSGSGHAIPLVGLGVVHGGLFWFFDAANPELLVKVLDGCGLDQHFWVYYSAGTNVGLTLTVRDTRTGDSRTYTHADLTPAAPVQDTGALACGASDAATTRLPQLPPSHVAGRDVAGGCVPEAQTLCIAGRFKVQVSFQTSQGGGRSGAGGAIPLDSLGVTRGGLLWFFGADNPEMLVKVIDGCAVNHRYWVFSAAGTNVGFTTTVTDTLTGQSKVYTNPDLTPALPVQDVDALPCP